MIEQNIRYNNQHQELYWRGDFFLPLARNFVAAIATAILAAILTFAIFTTNAETIKINSMLVFGVVFCVTIINAFLGPQVAERSRLYKLGLASAQAQINSLESQLDSAHQQLETFTKKSKIASKTKNGQLILQAAKDSHQLIRWHYGGHSIKRADCKVRGMGQQRWQRAREMLTNAGIFTARENQWHYTTFSEAVTALQRHYEYRTGQSTTESVVTPL